jgi:outer membrane protein assembly factor BamD (BamD/ComL family)
MTLTTVHTYAQSASDAYNKGVALMNKGDYQGAIASFKASMAINKSAANVKKCNAQISKCNRLAKKKTTDRKDEPKKTTQKTLVVSAKNVGFGE